MNVNEAIYNRRAVRDYTGEPVDDEAIRAVIDAAIQAPSGMNRQPWAFVVVRNRALLDAYSQRAKDFIQATESADTVIAQLHAELSSPDFNIFRNAPALIVICAIEGDTMAIQDCCLAAQNLMLAAYANGLGTCWIGPAESWLRQPDVKHDLRIPSHHIPVAPIIIGTPRGQPPAPGRHAPHITWVAPGLEPIVE